jgi:hypothetical protein
MKSGYFVHLVSIYITQKSSILATFGRPISKLVKSVAEACFGLAAQLTFICAASGTEAIEPMGCNARDRIDVSGFWATMFAVNRARG